jgi:hypothetical protein
VNFSEQLWRISVSAVTFITRGERHSKGSEYGATALMIQVRDLDALEEHG